MANKGQKKTKDPLEELIEDKQKLKQKVPTAKPVVDFHHQVIAHAGRTL